MFGFGKRKQKKVIIFIHGLKNKPPQRLLHKWYRKSIVEGYKRRGKIPKHFKLDIAYWADILYSQPLDPLIKDKEHSLYISGPYVHAAIESNKNRAIPEKTYYPHFEKVIDSIFLSKNKIINVKSIFSWIAGKSFKDLHTYYREDLVTDGAIKESAKKIIRKRLINLLQKHKDKEILLIGHSMGSIIAYDVLTFDTPNIPIHTFVTIGSPLGLPMIKREIFEELEIEFNSDSKLPTPSNIIMNWYNLADLDDNVAINHEINGDYKPNSEGICPIDKVVMNDFAYDGEVNPHKSFGYLRSREVTKIIDAFLSQKEQGIFTIFIDKLKGLFNL